MTIDLLPEDTTLIRAKGNPCCSVELKTIDGVNITATVYNFKKDKKVIIIRHKQHSIRTYVFENKLAYTSFNFESWKNSNVIYNSLEDGD